MVRRSNDWVVCTDWLRERESSEAMVDVCHLTDRLGVGGRARLCGAVRLVIGEGWRVGLGGRVWLGGRVGLGLGLGVGIGTRPHCASS